MLNFYYNDCMYNLKKAIAKTIGATAEKVALDYLRQQGLILVEKNFHSRQGEIDLIMKEGNSLVFIEVRCRKDKAQVSAAESVTPQKKRKIYKTAQYYLQTFDEPPSCRFDVIAMTHNPQNSRYTIDWIKQAF